MDKKVRIAIVGCGGIANGKHMPSLKKFSDRCEMVAFCDIIPEKAEKAAKEYGVPGAKVYTNYKDMLADKTIEFDTVHVCTPNVAHCPITVDSFAAGKNVMCEKPMAHCASDAQKMLDAWKASGKKFTIGYFKVIMRFDNDTVAEVELGTYFLTDKVEQKWFERHWIMCGDKACAYVDGFDPEGKIVTTSKLLTNVGGKRTMTAAGPTRSFGPPADGVLVSEPIEKAQTRHEDYFENYRKAYFGEGEFLVKIPEVRRVLRLMDAVRESARTGESVRFEWE